MQFKRPLSRFFPTSMRIFPTSPAKLHNSRPSCDGRLKKAASRACLTWVSIHARRATGDGGDAIMVGTVCRFNSRPSCDGRRSSRQRCASTAAFQFTPVVRRATAGRQARRPRSRCFNSRPSCDGRRQGAECAFASQAVSIHARRATGDKNLASAHDRKTSFNSRPSCDGRHTKPCRRRWRTRFQFTPVVRRATLDGQMPGARR